MRNKKAISLIVLSITILVMAILAATAIIALEDSGIIGRSKNTVTQQNYNEEYTRLVVIKNGILTDNLGEITVDEYIAELTNQGIIEVGRTNNADGTVTVTTKTGFEIILSQNGTSDLNITIDGYTPPSNNTGNSGNSGNSGNAGGSGNGGGTTQGYTLSGKWTFNNTLTQTGWASGTQVKHENVNFYRIVDGVTDSTTLRTSFDYYPAGTMDDKNATSASVNCEAILTHDMSIYMLYHFGTCANSSMHITPKTVNSAYKIIDFGSTPQTVSEEFYNWFTANAVKCIEFTLQYDPDDYYNMDGYDAIISCTALPGMTWSEWVNSVHNYSTFYVDSSKNIEDGECYEICLNKTNTSTVKSSEKIIEGHNYWLYWD